MTSEGYKPRRAIGVDWWKMSLPELVDWWTIVDGPYWDVIWCYNQGGRPISIFGKMEALGA